MKILIAVLFSFILLPVHAQVGNELKAADVIAMNAPDSCQASVAALGRYFSSAFKKPAFRARAIYTWTAMNISYDVSNKGRINAATPFGELVEQTMKTRFAICQGYASVFKALCDACGITAYLVQGYTRQNGNITEMSHAWVIAFIDSSFFGFDPTWGAGYITKGRYTRYYNEQYFMMKPEVLIRDHMPFDPMWECLNYPITNQDFSKGKTVPENSGVLFAYADSIRVYNSLESKEQCSAALRRLEAAGIINNPLFDWSKYLRDCISNERHNDAATVTNKKVRLFNDAVSAYNNCISAFNIYADFWNRGFNPPKPDPVIVDMLNLCYSYLDSCKNNLWQVDENDTEMKQSVKQLQQAVDETKENLDKQKVFLKIYFNTDPISRPQLFRNYNAAGFPVKKSSGVKNNN